MDEYEELPGLKINREIGKKYVYQNKIVIWTGRRLTCEHHRLHRDCKICKGSGICEHNNIKKTAINAIFTKSANI